METCPATPAYLGALRVEARRADVAAIVVGYDKHTRFVWSSCGDPATALDALLRSGGEPVAILGADLIGNAFSYRLNPFPEYEEDAWARKYLAAVGERLATMLEGHWHAARN